MSIYESEKDPKLQLACVRAENALLKQRLNDCHNIILRQAVEILTY